MTRRPLLAIVALAAIAGACSSEPGGAITQPTSVIASTDTELVPVQRQDVVETVNVEAAVGNGVSIGLPIEADGIVTWVPDPDTVLRTGDVVVEVAGRPIVLVVGESPLYRPLRLVGRAERDEAGSRLGAQTGSDVAQLQRFLLDNGFDDAGRLQVDEVFGTSTKRAVQAWQQSVGHPTTGVIDSSQMLFMTNVLLLETTLVVGQRFEPMRATGTGTILEVVGSTSLREFFPKGSWVEVRPNDPVLGVVTRSSRITAGESNDVRQLIEISVDDLTPNELGQSVQVVGSVTRASDAITIPVRALLATTNGSWQVETGAGTTVTVELVDVVETTAIVSGLEEGTDVVVPL